MDKFITEKELEKFEPVEPKFLRFKIFVGSFVTATIMALLMSIMFLFMIDVDTITDKMFFGILGLPFFVSYLVIGIFSLLYISEKRVFITLRIVQKWLGIREYNLQCYEYSAQVMEYDRQMRYKREKMKYSDYE